jgi:hypothetical protein
MKSAGKNETLTNRKAVMLMMTALVAVIMILLAVFHGAGLLFLKMWVYGIHYTPSFSGAQARAGDMDRKIKTLTFPFRDGIIFVRSKQRSDSYVHFPSRSRLRR